MFEPSVQVLAARSIADCAVSLGPYKIEGLDSIDRDRAAWSLEVVSTQHLAITLDTALENIFSKMRHNVETPDKDYFTFVRCLRNAFAHDPYEPTWDLSNSNYRRQLTIEDTWIVDLSDSHNSPVVPQSYRYASGLLRLVDRGVALMEGGRE